MNEIAQAVGELGQGGLAARAFEPSAGEDSGHTRETACLNCATPLIGSHCHACGQRGHVHRTLGAFFHDLLHGVLHFEGKIWRTLPLLVWHPGRLTREYIDGRRASYVSPIALFLFVIFLLFAVFSALGGAQALTESVNANPDRETERAHEAASAELEQLRGRLGQQTDPAERAELETRIADVEERIDLLEATRAVVSADVPVAEAGDTPTEARLKSAWQKAKENPQLLLYKLQTNAYKFSWLLIPISVPFVALTFLWRRQFGLYDHTVFATYSITFMIALATAASLLIYFVSGVLGALLLLYAPVHMYRQLRGAYALSRFSALWRLTALSIFAWLAIGLFVTLLALMSE